MDSPSVVAVPKPDDKALVSAALKLLSRRDFSRSEFINRLTGAEFEKADVEAAADWCHEQGFLNEARFAESTSRRLGTKYGAQRIAHTLRQKGVAEEQVSAAVATLKESELDRAGALWARKFGTVAESADEKSRQIRYLQARGFSFAVVKQVIAGTSQEA
ncbi:MAG: recombination regulator RecX [Burkholderiales bacterium]|nr:recombination regulator RecX [Burkholderiales bacterium]